MCEWIWELELLKNFLRILSEWFAKHLEISLRVTARGFESHPLRQDGALPLKKWSIQMDAPLFVACLIVFHYTDMVQRDLPPRADLSGWEAGLPVPADSRYF